MTILYQREALEKELRDKMAQALAGDKDAYEELLKKIATLVRGYIANSMSPKSRTEEKVEDIVQEVLISIHRKKHLYRLDMPFLPWLFAIARYRFIDRVRVDSRRPLLVEWEEEFDPAGPEKKTLSDERALLLEELLEGLSPRQKEIFVLAKAEGVPLAEIAERFKMSLSAVKVTVHRTLQTLRKKLPRSMDNDFS